MNYHYISGKAGLLFFLSFFLLFCSSFISEKNKMEGIIFENNAILITSRIEQCKLPQNGTENVSVFLSIKNKTDKKIAVTFQQELFYDGKCATCGSEEYRYTIELEPNSTKQATCGTTSEYPLTVFHHMPNGMTKSQLTDLQFSGVKITELN